MSPPHRHGQHRVPGAGAGGHGQLSLRVAASRQDVRQRDDAIQAGPRQEEGQGQGEKCRKQEKQVRK